MSSPESTSSAELLADVLLGSCSASTVAWCPVNGLLAVGARQHAKLACVYLISPFCVEHKVSLAVPLQGPEDDLVCVTWSPAGCRRVLLTATRAGAVSAWSQQPPVQKPDNGASNSQFESQNTDLPGSVFTIANWWCPSDTSQFSLQQQAPTAAGQPQLPASQEQLLSLQWLQQPSCWPYSNRVLQEQDFQTGSVPNMFAPAAPRRRPASSASASTNSSSNNQNAAQPESSMFHWVQPGTLAFLAVLSSGKAVVGWATWAAQGVLRWHLAPSLALLPNPAAGSIGQQQQQVCVLAADVTLSPAGVLVALATLQEPDRVQVLELQGNPLHHHCLSAALRSRRPALQVQPLAACGMAAGAPCSVLGLSWDPESSGQRLAVLTSSGIKAEGGTAGNSSSAGLVTLLNLAEQPQQQGAAAAGQSYMLAAVTRAHVAHALQRQQCVWLLDGLLLGQQLLDAQTLARLPVSLPQPAGLGFMQEEASTDPQLQALTASAHRVAVAAVYCTDAAAGNSSSFKSSSSSRLVLYSIPPVSKLAAGGAVLPTLAGRLVWSLLLQRHSWDLVLHVVHAARQMHPAGSTGSPAEVANSHAQRVAQVLSLVDRKLSAQAVEVYSMYAVRWDVLKYALVCRTPGSEAQAFSIDMRLRLLVPVLELHLAAAAREEEVRQTPSQLASSNQQASSTAQGSSQAPAPQPPSSSCIALAEYFMELVEFEVASVNTWLHRRVAAAASAASAGGDGAGASAAAAAVAAASVKAVPCIRFLLDYRSNTKLAAAGGKATELAKLGRSGGSTARVYSLWKLLHKAFDGRTEQPQNWEDLLMEVVPGPFELHTLTQPRAFPTSLYNLKLPPEQVLRHLQTTAEWQQVPVLTDADITARATRLGLLPANTLVAKANYAQEAHLHLSFRKQLPLEVLLGTAAPPAGPATPSDSTAGKRGLTLPLTPQAAAKRRRWEQQIQDAMGSNSCAACVGSSEVVDLVNMGWASPTALALQSVDGAVLAREVLMDVSAGPAGDARPARRVAAGITNNWAYTCPITGEAWLLGPSV